MTLKNDNLKITVVGLGYVGLPLLVLIASKGFNVIGYDISDQRIQDIHDKNSFSFDYDKDTLDRYLKAGSLKLSSSSNCLKQSDIIIVCVPTLVDENYNPVTKHLLDVTHDITQNLTPNKVIIYESSTYPGCTRDLIAIMNSTTLKVGVDFFVGFSPERIDPSNKKYRLKNIPKVISGLTRKCSSIIKDFYKGVFDEVFVVSSLETAEFMKLFENTYRYINIAYVNEMALAAEKLGINIWEVIKASKTKPFGYSPFYPGPGVGGACIPVNPWYMQHTLKKINSESTIINTAKKINSAMPLHVVNKIIASNKYDSSDLRVLIIGVAYKKNVADSRLSPAIDIIKLLLDKKIDFKLFDPYIQQVDLDNQTIAVHNNSLNELIKWANVAVLHTDHDGINYELLLESNINIVDTRGILEGINSQNISSLGKGDF